MNAHLRHRRLALTQTQSIRVYSSEQFDEIIPHQRGIDMNLAHVAMLLVIASAASAGRDASLSTVLTPDGRIMEGASGSFDPDGFRMTYGSDGEPLFLAEASLSGEPAPFSEGQYDAGTWYPLGSGVNERVLALAVSGTDVYVGGD
ncbi:MAG: hypothetical protein IT351_02295, partial [Candidatus Fermentibacter sp.]|nr:hypothetical protein [Candidatus Fermentibacter sp.]